MDDIETPTPPDFDYVMRLARQWHYSEVRTIADRAIKEIAEVRTSNPMTSEEAREWLTEWVDQTTDDHPHVIYNGQAAMLLAASDNEEAYFEETGEVISDRQVRACAALRADVWDLLNARAGEWECDDKAEAEAEADGHDLP